MQMVAFIAMINVIGIFESPSIADTRAGLLEY